MAPRIKSEEQRKSAPQCRFKCGTVENLRSYPEAASRYGFAALAPFMRELMEAVKVADPTIGFVRIPRRLPDDTHHGGHDLGGQHPEGGGDRGDRDAGVGQL